MMGVASNSYYYLDDIILDEKVNDCLTKFYFSMLAQEECERDKYYNEFEKMYLELNEEQQEMAKVEIAKILEIDYKPKTKEKER